MSFTGRMSELRDVSLRRPEEEELAVHTRHKIINIIYDLYSGRKKYTENIKPAVLSLLALSAQYAISIETNILGCYLSTCK